jgi:hypothetical protein
MIATTFLVQWCGVLCCAVLCRANDSGVPVETTVADFEVRTQTKHTSASDQGSWEKELRAKRKVETKECRPNF